MVRQDQTGPLMCVMVLVGVVALVLSAGEGPDRRISGSSARELSVPDAPATAGALLLTGPAGGGSLDFPQ